MENSDFDYYIETEDDYADFDDYSTFVASNDILNGCILPTLYQLLQNIFPIVTVSIIIRLLAFKNVQLKHINIINSLLSLTALVYLYKTPLVIYLVLFVIKVYLIINFLNLKRFKQIFAMISLSTLHMFVGRFYVFNDQDWNSVKGIEMILIMKLLSLVIDLKQKTQFKLFDLISYLLSINTAMFGPWISYSDHLYSLKNKSLKITSLLRNLFISIACLIASNCLFSSIDHYLNINFLLRLYFEALSFRLSNYFVSYFSQALCNLNGSSYITVTQPLAIEFPRSLLDVVTSWNIPIHNWLKCYAFKPIKQYGSLIAVFSTYFVSSMLHAFDANISLILFSLGFFTYVEFGLRKNFSKLFNCCILARKCSNKCSHRFKNNHFVTISINFLFFVLNLYHLAYLGQILFHANSSHDSSQKWFQIVLTKWYLTYYSSHLINLFGFLVFKLTQFLI